MRRAHSKQTDKGPQTSPDNEYLIAWRARTGSESEQAAPPTTHSWTSAVCKKTRDHWSSEGKRERRRWEPRAERTMESGGGGGWVLHCDGTFFVPCECGIYLLHHSWGRGEKQWSGQRWGEEKQASQDRREWGGGGRGGGGRKSSVGGSPAPPPTDTHTYTHPTLAGEIDVRVSWLRGLKGGMDGAWGRGSGM